MTKRIVEFENWCEKCKNWKLPENESPCWECLNEPVNEDSRKPVLWESNS